MFFGSFWGWLQGQLATYVGTHTAALAAAIEPAAVTLGTIFVMVWGFLAMTGRIEEPIVDGLKRVVVLGVVLGVSLQLWAYNAVIVDTVLNTPAELLAALIGTTKPIQTLDIIWERGGSVASELWNKGGVFNGDFGFYLAGGVVYAVMAGVTVYTLYLLALALIASSVILVMGPLFILLLLFDTTKRFFEAWIAMLSNYLLVGVIAGLLAALLLQIVQSFAEQTAALGSGVTTVDALNMLLVSFLALLILRQVPSIASGLASGIALGSMGAVSGLLRWGLGTGQRTLYDFSRGAIDGWQREPISRWDSLRRGAGNLAGRQLADARDHLAGPSIGGSVYHDAQGRPMVPREVVMPPRKHFG